MKIYKLIPFYDAKTGKRLEDKFEETDMLICDYTGMVITSDDEDRPITEIVVNEIGGSEESYYYDAEKAWFEEQRIDYSSVVEQPYHFAVSGDKDYTTDLVVEWHANFQVEDHPFYFVRSMAELLRKARVRTVKKLIESKTFTPQQLGFEQEY